MENDKPQHPLAQAHEALHNLIVLARPHFSDDIQALALAEAEKALETLAPHSGKYGCHLELFTLPDDARPTNA